MIYSEEKFRAKFVDTIISTAINPGSSIAADKSLHELNVFLPGVKKDFFQEAEPEEKQLYWVGIIGLEDVNISDEFLKKNKLEIFVGGDVRYGLGEMILVRRELLSRDLPILWKKNSGYIPVGESAPVNGTKVELLVEAIESWKGAELKVKLRGTGFGYVPGSRIGYAEGGLKKGVLGVSGL